MIISRSPFRVSLFGGGSDYPQWYERYGGSVLGLALDRYCYVNLRKLPPFFEYRHRVVYSKTELVNRISDIEHPAVRGVLQHSGISCGLEIHHDGDLPARSGLGSSSAFTVGLLHALHALEGKMRSKDQLACEAIHVEQNVIKEPVGSQDQIWAAYGGLNRIDFMPTGWRPEWDPGRSPLEPAVAAEDDRGRYIHLSQVKDQAVGQSHARPAYRVQPLIMPPSRRTELVKHLILCFTGFTRMASVVAERQIANMAQRESHIREMMKAVDEAQSILTSTRALNDIGDLLHTCWRLKKELADGVSTPAIDEIYEAGLDAGALGGKLLGAGGGGFMLFYIHPAYHAKLKERLRKLITLPVGIDHEGSRIVVYGFGQEA